MKNIFFASLIISVACFTPSCNKCKDVGGYYPDASQLKKYSFKRGSYWVYQDSITGIIDSQSVYDYTAQNNVVLGYTTGANADIFCPVSTDAFNLSIASFWNMVLHDSIFFSTEGDVYVSESDNPYNQFHLSTEASYNHLIVNFTVSGHTYPKVYLSTSYVNSQMFFVDSIGVVKWVFNDTINGQHTWSLLRYHVINP